MLDNMEIMTLFLFALFHAYACSWSDLPRKDFTCSRRHLHVIDYPKCVFTKELQRLVCFNGLPEQRITKTMYNNTQELVLCDWPNATFDPQMLRRFTQLRKLRLGKSNLTGLSTAFPIEMTLLENIAVIDTKISALPKDAFANLQALRVLDLRNNSFEEINDVSVNVTTLQQLYLAGNPLRCTEDTAWILDSDEGSVASRVVDRDKLLCGAPYDGRPLVPVVEIIVTLRKECKRTICDCELVYVVGRVGKLTAEGQVIVFTSVNCSHRGLTDMPDFLPANTTTLHLTGNKIKDLTPLTANPVYESVLDLYIDDNLVESIVRLEGSNWLDRFRLLNLRGNKFTNFPTYILENILHYGNLASLYLGNNSWTCDCHFTPGFQMLLMRYPYLVKDINDVRCASTSENDNANKQIRDLKRTEICFSTDEESWLYPLDILNVILASLIFLVLGKLLYDYWSFKKTGKVPWIVTKIP